MTSLRAILSVAVLVAFTGGALAKLPPGPPQTEQQKKEAADKAAAATAKTNADLAHAQDRVAMHYIAEQRAKGIIVTPQIAVGSASADSGKPPSTKGTPEKAGAHSPPTK